MLPAAPPTDEKVLEQERLRVVGEIASGVAHELNNTLHALSLRVARLRADPVAPAQEENLDAIERIVKEASARVRRLQDLARSREDVPVTDVDLRDVVAEAIAVAQAQLTGGGDHERVVLEARLPVLPPVLGSAAELQQILVGIFLNARDAMPRGGRVVVYGQSEPDAVVIEIADEGSGIPPALIGRLFDPFFTTKGRKGTGLGLSIASGVMRRLGGNIGAANRPEGGAVFTLRFPRGKAARAAGSPRNAAPRAAPPDAARRMQRVLVVDDDGDNLDAARWMLEHLGQRVEVASSGADAVDRVAAGERYDLVLCDLGMPDIDGWAVVARLRPSLPDARIYLLTGWAEQLHLDDPRLAPVDGLLSKPLGADDLERLLEGGGPARTPRDRVIPSPAGG